jgi:hypothetical protein
MSASLIGWFGSSAFRRSTTAVSMSLTGSCFSSESAPGPFHHGIRRRGGPFLDRRATSVIGTKLSCQPIRRMSVYLPSTEISERSPLIAAVHNPTSRSTIHRVGAVLPANLPDLGQGGPNQGWAGHMMAGTIRGSCHGRYKVPPRHQVSRPASSSLSDLTVCTRHRLSLWN